MSKVRKQFVIYAMVAVFVLVTVLLLVINGTNFTMVAEDADRITEMIAMEKGKLGEEKKRLPGQGEQQRNFGRMDAMGPGSPELAFTARYFTFRFDEKDQGEAVAFHISAFTEEEALNLAKQLLKEKTGWVETKYRYRVYKNGDFTYVTVVDQGRELLPSYRILIISVFGELGVMAVCLIFLIFISKRLFRPLEEADRKQRKFLAEAKNEFQVPLTVINANAELLERENGSGEYTQAIHRQVKRMTALTKQLDTLSLLEDERGRNETCDFSMIVAAATDGAMTKYQEKGLQVLGVAVKDKPAHTEAAVKELGITYPQIINAQNTPSEAYHFSGIPYVLLFAPDGTIIARGLRGEDIGKKLAEIFGE